MGVSIGSEEYDEKKEYEDSTEFRRRFFESEEEEKNSINKFSDVDEIQDFSELTSEYILDSIWQNVTFFSTLDGPVVTTTNNDEVFNGASRQALTSNTVFRYSDKACRLRANFYLGTSGSNDLDDLNLYIGTGGTSTLETGITSINQSEMEYVAFVINEGQVKIASKNLVGSTEKETQYYIDDGATYSVEIRYYPGERADFFLNDNFLGGITETLPTAINCPTYFPFMTSLQRVSATNKSATIEFWEFIQQK